MHFKSQEARLPIYNQIEGRAVRGTYTPFGQSSSQGDMPSTTGNSRRFIRKTIASAKKRKPRYVLLLGARKVGKTALVKRFADGVFDEQYKPTVEDCFVVDYDYEMCRLNLHFLDTAGSSEFPAMRDLNIRQASMVMIAYDVNDRKSLEEAVYLHQVVTGLRENTIPIVLVGTKTDLTKNGQEHVTNESVNEFLRANPECLHSFCSTKLDDNVIETFHLGFAKMTKALTSASQSSRNGKDANGCCTIL